MEVKPIIASFYGRTVRVGGPSIELHTSAKLRLVGILLRER